ncbi:hypothetical protein ACWGCW_36885 [Streptomyces sp. NPDC054933]
MISTGVGAPKDADQAGEVVVRWCWMGPPVLVGVGIEAQQRLLVGAGQKDAGHQRVMPVAPAAGAMQRDGNPGGVAAAGEVAG